MNVKVSKKKIEPKEPIALTISLTKREAQILASVVGSVSPVTAAKLANQFFPREKQFHSADAMDVLYGIWNSRLNF